MIDDLRLMISSGGSSDVEDLHQLFRFRPQVFEFRFGKQSRLDDKLAPEQSLVNFLENDGDLVHEVGPRIRPKRYAIVGRDRATASSHLSSDSSSACRNWQVSGHLQDPDSKCHRPAFQLLPVHTLRAYSKS
jgi:hypothetical protein